MTNAFPRGRSRNIYVSSGGDDDNNGFTDTYAKRTLAAAVTAAVAETPTIESPVSILEFGSTPYTGTFSFDDYIRVNMPLSRITGAVTKLPSTSQFNLLSVFTNGTGGETAFKAGGATTVGIDVKGILAVGLGDTGVHIDNGSGDIFGNFGLVRCFQDDSIGFLYDSTGVPEDIFIRKVQLDGSNSKGFVMDVTSPEALSFRCGKIEGHFGTGNIGIHAIKGEAACFVNELDLEGNTAIIHEADAHFNIISAAIEGDVIMNGGQLNLQTQDQIGNLDMNGGDLNYTGQLIEGDVDSSAGGLQINIQEITGNIDSSGTSIMFINSQLITGAVNLLGFIDTIRTQSITGNVTCGGLLNLLDCSVTGSVTLSAGKTYFDSDVISSNLTINAGAIGTGQISEVNGAITIAGTFNGEIAGVKYGSWDEGSDFLKDFNDPGNVPNTWSDIGYFQIDTNTDTVTAFSAGYRQNAAGNRTHKVRIIDADDATVYYEASNPNTGVATLIYDALTVVNPLPTNEVVNLVFQHERDGGAGLANTSISFEFNRV